MVINTSDKVSDVDIPDLNYIETYLLCYISPESSLTIFNRFLL